MSRCITYINILTVASNAIPGLWTDLRSEWIHGAERKLKLTRSSWIQKASCAAGALALEWTEMKVWGSWAHNYCISNTNGKTIYHMLVKATAVWILHYLNFTSQAVSTYLSCCLSPHIGCITYQTRMPGQEVKCVGVHMSLSVFSPVT